MRFLKSNNNSGYSLVELTIAGAITAMLGVAGYQALSFFSKQTAQNAKKLDDLGEFNQLTKDLLKFTEGAGVSTIYLNFPIKVKGCNPGVPDAPGKPGIPPEPCIMKEDTVKGGFKLLADSEIPDAAKTEDCIQFYQDAKGTLGSKLAYPGKDAYSRIAEFSTFSYGKTDVSEYYATWILKDTKSPPFLMLKLKEAAPILSYLRGGNVQISRSLNEGASGKKVEVSFFDSSDSKEDVLALEGYPFLIYNSIFPNHYTIQYAKKITSCVDDNSFCIAKMKDIGASDEFTVDDDAINASVAPSYSGYPSSVYAVEFKPIDMNSPYFKSLRDLQKLPSSCFYSWGDGKQAPEEYFFPSSAYSVGASSEATSDLNYEGLPLNVLHLNHYYTTKDVLNASSSLIKGLMVALPIDIITFKVEATDDVNKNSLVAHLWHATEIKKKTKISHLKAPFTLTRKLGTPEIGIWYNPISKPAVAAP